MKMNKTLEDLLAKYDVRLRAKSSVVEHAAYHRKTEVTPIQFAVYELALKSNYLTWKLNGLFSPDYVAPNGVYVPPDSHQHYLGVFAKDGIELPADIGTVNSNADVYHYCVRLLAEDGLYYDLLD